ncbi:MAG: YfiR family protein [Vicinamibacterales bacterium]
MEFLKRGGAARPLPWAAMLALATLCALTAYAYPAAAAAQTASGADVRAAFLVNFSKFVEWPQGATAGGQFTIGILGDDAVAEALKGLVAGKSVGGQVLAARRVGPKDNLGDLQILFVGSSESARLADVLRRADGGSVLTVSDLDRFCQQGGTIEFRSERDRIRFDINLDQAARAGLVINSKLLALARTVHHATKPPGVSR